MDQRGFTLVELVVTIAIMAILTTMGTFAFSYHQKKGAIDSQTKMLYADLVQVRSQAMFEKKSRLVRLNSTSYAIYSSEVATSQPKVSKSLRAPLDFDGPTDLVFDSRGMLTDVEATTAICAKGKNAATADSVVVSTASVQLGKLQEGAACGSSKINAK